MADLSGQFLALYKALANLMNGSSGQDDPRVAELMQRVSALESEYTALTNEVGACKSGLATATQQHEQDVSGINAALAALTAQVNALATELGSDSDTADASLIGKSMSQASTASVKKWINTISGVLNTAKTDALNAISVARSVSDAVGNANDAANASGSIYARIKALLNSLGSANDTANRAGTTAWSRIKWCVDALGSDQGESTYPIYTRLRNLYWTVYGNNGSLGLGSSGETGSKTGNTLWKRFNWVHTQVSNMNVGTINDVASNASTASLWAHVKYAISEFMYVGKSNQTPDASSIALWPRVLAIQEALASISTGARREFAWSGVFNTTTDANATTGWYLADNKSGTNTTTGPARCQKGLPVHAEMCVDREGFGPSSGTDYVMMTLKLTMAHPQNGRMTTAPNTAPDNDTLIFDSNSSFSKWVAKNMSQAGVAFYGTGARNSIIMAYTAMSQAGAGTRCLDNKYGMNMDASATSHSSGFYTTTPTGAECWAFTYDYDNYRSSGDDHFAFIYATLRCKKV